MKKISVLITDDHYLFREGFARALKYNKSIGQVFTASCGKEAIKILETNFVDIVFMDLLMKELNGFEVIRIILSKNPEQKIIAISQYDDEGTIKKVIKLGGKGYITKTSRIQEINSSIKTVMDNKVYYSKDALESLSLNKIKDKTLPILDVPITNKEIEILVSLCNGLTEKQISDKHSISIRTVQWHKQNIMKKTRSESYHGLFKFAVENGYFKLK